MRDRQLNNWEHHFAQLHNLDERRKLEGDLLKGEGSLRLAEQIASDAVWDWNLETGQLVWSEIDGKVFNYPGVITDTDGNWWREHIHPEDRPRVVRGIQQLLAGEGSLWWDEYRFLRSDGSYTYILDRGVVLRQAAGQPARMLGAMIDLTLRQQAGQSLRLAKDAITDARRTKIEFLNNLSHELHTPMTVIIASLDLLTQRDPRPEQSNLLAMAETSAQRLQSLIEELFHFSRLKNHQIDLAKTLFDLRECVESAVGSFRRKAGDKGLQLRCAIFSETPRIVYGSSEHLAQVLRNLVDNAIKFTDCGEVVVQAQPTPGPEKQVLFTVRDTGIGIPDDQRQLLFQEFHQVDSSLTRRYDGIGLGLTIARKLVELMDGVIWVDSEEGEGSIFSFVLPLR